MKLSWIRNLIVTAILLLIFASLNSLKENDELIIKQLYDTNPQISIMTNTTQVAASFISEALSGLERDQQIKTCRKIIRNARFLDDKSGYFYIYDMNGINIAHATQPEKEGKNLINYQDCKGNYLIRDLINAAKKENGFVLFWWENPTTHVEEKKIGYVVAIKGTDFFIGSGVYLRD